jgi:hypothetical protein
MDESVRKSLFEVSLRTLTPNYLSDKAGCSGMLCCFSSRIGVKFASLHYGKGVMHGETYERDLALGSTH